MPAFALAASTWSWPRTTPSRSPAMSPCSRPFTIVSVSLNSGPSGQRRGPRSHVIIRAMRTGLGCLALAALVACGGTAASIGGAQRGRLSARPHASTGQCGAGLHRLGLDRQRDAVLYVPETSRARWPLLVLLHGAGGAPERIVERLRPVADAHAVILLAPASRAATWDGIRGEPGVDAEGLDDALKAAFDRCPVDRRVGIGGFSDGASYALTLGIANGDLFTHIIAFSPCVMSPSVERRGRPHVFIAHGRRDEILPFSQCGEALASRLQRDGYTVRFEPFDGPHTVPAASATAAFSWFIGTATQPRK